MTPKTLLYESTMTNLDCFKIIHLLCFNGKAFLKSELLVMRIFLKNISKVTASYTRVTILKSFRKIPLKLLNPSIQSSEFGFSEVKSNQTTFFGYCALLSNNVLIVNESNVNLMDEKAPCCEIPAPKHFLWCYYKWDGLHMCRHLTEDIPWFEWNYLWSWLDIP